MAYQEKEADLRRLEGSTAHNQYPLQKILVPSWHLVVHVAIFFQYPLNKLNIYIKPPNKEIILKTPHPRSQAQSHGQLAMVNAQGPGHQRAGAFDFYPLLPPGETIAIILIPH